MNNIIVYENGDASIYASIGEAESSIEAIDVLNGEYFIFTDDAKEIEQQVVDGTWGRKIVRLKATGRDCSDRALIILRKMTPAFPWALNLHDTILSRKGE